MSRKIYPILSFLLIVSFALTACGAPATQAPPAPTEVPPQPTAAEAMQPTAAEAKLPGNLNYTEDGFILNDFQKGGIFAAGCANKPADVVSSNQNATGMALKAIQTLAAK